MLRVGALFLTHKCQSPLQSRIWEGTNPTTAST